MNYTLSNFVVPDYPIIFETTQKSVLGRSIAQIRTVYVLQKNGLRHLDAWGMTIYPMYIRTISRFLQNQTNKPRLSCKQ